MVFSWYLSLAYFDKGWPIPPRLQNINGNPSKLLLETLPFTGHLHAKKAVPAKRDGW
jgi:hypothetical protein